jgi:CubicO group peptidase (beta-lactamase class C family)
MLLNGGELNGKRLLSWKTVQLITSEHVSEEVFTAGHPSEKGYGFGLSVSVLFDPRKASNLASKGNYGWSGAFGTTYRADPAEQMIALFMIQNARGGPKEMSRDFHHLAMEAIVD